MELFKMEKGDKKLITLKEKLREDKTDYNGHETIKYVYKIEHEGQEMEYIASKAVETTFIAAIMPFNREFVFEWSTFNNQDGVQISVYKINSKTRNEWNKAHESEFAHLIDDADKKVVEEAKGEPLSKVLDPEYHDRKKDTQIMLDKILDLVDRRMNTVIMDMKEQIRRVLEG
tara:strand:- start:945 stop:1463 length:519 start_codon:yes stop_codon:yes gene_type:complete